METWVNLPAPGAGPVVDYADIPVGTKLMGLAPIGIRWRAVMRANGPKPEGNCPRGEFSLTHALINGAWYEVQDLTVIKKALANVV